MKIVVIGGTGLIGSKTVVILRQRGHDVAAASPQSGVNTITGEGLKEALAGAQVVIDLANSPSFEDKAVLDFFKTSEGNLLPAEAAAGVGHHVALSIVAIDRTDNGYFRAKLAQEKLIEASGVPYTIVRSTQFMEFLRGIADSSATGNTVRLPPVLFQPIAADDVAANVAEAALASPRNGVIEIAGPERASFTEIVARYLKAIGDPRQVVSDPAAGYWGGRVEERSLVPLGEARLGAHWSRRMAPPLTGGSLILHPAAGPALSRSAQRIITKCPSGRYAGAGRRTKEATMSKLFALVLLCVMTSAAMAQEAKVTSLMSKELTENPGKEVLMIMVEYPPGSSDPIHRHNAQAFVYVLEGSIVMQVKGGKEVTLTPGQTFYEGPDDIHVVGRNASRTNPAKFVVFMIKDKGAPVLVPVK